MTSPILIIFSFTNKNHMFKYNLLHFIEYGTKTEIGEFVIVCDELVDFAIPNLSKNITIIYRHKTEENESIYKSFNHVLNIKGFLYEHYIFISDICCGPFVPKWANIAQWPLLFIKNNVNTNVTSPFFTISKKDIKLFDNTISTIEYDKLQNQNISEYTTMFKITPAMSFLYYHYKENDIERALYGIENEMIDVSHFFNLKNSNITEIPICNNLFGDPCPGHSKTFRLIYKNNKIKELIIPENNILYCI